MKRVLIFLVLYVPLVVLAIMGGKDKKQDGNHRFVVSVQDDRKRHFCGGALIAKRFVLTAATCVKDKRPRDLLVAANVTNLNDKYIQLFTVDDIISKNAAGQGEVHNNIALLHLTTTFENSVYIYPISLPSGSEEEPQEEWQRCYFYGWGQKEIKKPDVPSEIIQVGRTKVVALKDCRIFNKDIDEFNLCTYDYNDNARLCNLDTGDPLVSYNEILWGIATRPDECLYTITARPDVYTRIISHKDWIVRTMERSASTEPKSQITTIGIFVFLIISFNQ